MRALGFRPDGGSYFNAPPRLRKMRPAIRVDGRAPHPHSRMRVPRILQRLLVAAAALAAFDVVLARTWLASGRLGDRPLPPFGAITDPVQLAALERAESGAGGLASLSSFDRELGWTLRPGAKSENGETAINADGERGARTYAPEPPTGVLRLACYGDSFTYGDEVPDRFS